MKFVKQGETYNRLTAIRRNGTDSSGKNAKWLFKCSCGKKVTTIASMVVNGRVKSCGCYQKEIMSKRTTHKFIQKYKTGTKNPRFYSLWSGIRNRCQNKNNNSYKNYGGRGIKVCKEWEKFEDFYNDMFDSYEKSLKKIGKSRMSLDRIDNNGDYCKNNCRWATRVIQARNKRNNHKESVWGEELCISEAIEKYKLNKPKVFRMLKKKMTLEQICAETGVPIPDPIIK